MARPSAAAASNAVFSAAYRRTIAYTIPAFTRSIAMAGSLTSARRICDPYAGSVAAPGITARFDQQLSVPIVAVNLPAGEVVRFDDKEAVVEVENRPDSPIAPDDIKAVLDLGNRVPGIYNVPVQLVAPNVAVQSLSPASVTLTIERIETRGFPIAANYRAESRPSVVVGSLRMTPDTVIVHGATSALSHIAEVRADVPLPSTGSRLDAMVHPIAIDSRGQAVPDVQVVPNMVRVEAMLGPSTAGKNQ